ncbi:hypothetical protein CF15_00545 [Pyrodictium occultum]|uniref:ABC transporter substrate-binding protein n=1 Tax=Pyrodictium occultum TaxID=2309 RepID=A0A0V8RTT4_PYROC|nr:zinc ABC transporter substrate-binding protein [Pyrodictium occultum]KSW11389.1 hypothetical protein CF15_00545 [Pyrodictium occultum]
MTSRAVMAIALVAVIVAVAVAAYMMSSGGSSPAATTGKAAPTATTVSTALGSTTVTGGGKGLLVAVTFPNLKYDVEQLLCSDDSVYPIASSAIDPHEYQLTPEDISHVKKADLVISLAHAPFELKLRDIVESSKLLEVPNIPGMRFLINPDTGKRNPHMIIYDPGNYIVFVKAVAEKLSALRPSCRKHYLEKAAWIEEQIKALMSSIPKLNATAVASLPYTQYAVSWMGIRVVKLLKKDAGVQVTPKDIEEVEKLMKEGKAKLAVIAVFNGEPATPADEKLLELAEKHNVPVLRVPSPFGPGTMVNKLRAVVTDVEKLSSAIQES